MLQKWRSEYIFTDLIHCCIVVFFFTFSAHLCHIITKFLNLSLIAGNHFRKVCKLPDDVRASQQEVP